MSSTIRWGLLAAGGIAETFALALQEAEGAELVAVGSRDQVRATNFADRFAIPHAHGSYAELAADPDVDAVYVATPHTFHARDTILCLEQGKHVLCEKPFAVNSEEARRMIAAARSADRLLMEAMWTRFLPSVISLREQLAAGAIGEVRLLQADFGIQPPFDAEGRLFNAELAGGALLDLGVYAVSLGHALFGAPSKISGSARLGETGVDEDGAIVLDHGQGRFTLAYQSLRVATPREAVIRGTAGEIRLPEPWWGASAFTLTRPGAEPETHSFRRRGRGYTHMAEAFMGLLADGQRESAIMPHADSLDVLQTLDTLRRQWGLRYPFE